MEKSSKYLLGGGLLAAVVVGVGMGRSQANRRSPGPYGYRILRYENVNGQMITVWSTSTIYTALGVDRNTVSEEKQQNIHHARKDYEDGYTWADWGSLFSDIEDYINYTALPLTLVPLE
jgi:hypothetical protein